MSRPGDFIWWDDASARSLLHGYGIRNGVALPSGSTGDVTCALGVRVRGAGAAADLAGNTTAKRSRVLLNF